MSNSSTSDDWLLPILAYCREVPERFGGITNLEELCSYLDCYEHACSEFNGSRMSAHDQKLLDDFGRWLKFEYSTFDHWSSGIRHLCGGDAPRDKVFAYFDQFLEHSGIDWPAAQKPAG